MPASYWLMKVSGLGELGRVDDFQAHLGFGIGLFLDGLCHAWRLQRVVVRSTFLAFCCCRRAWARR
ncbi:MAG: hypothetical protein WKF47_17045 [Geodermatophilaceae bacterium]